MPFTTLSDTGCIRLFGTKNLVSSYCNIPELWLSGLEAL